MRLRNDKRDQRIREGEKRDAAWRELPLLDKLRSLASRPGHSYHQVFKLTGLDMSAKAALAELTEPL